uniref:NADH-ubiquinone oxidoreductase chain 4L n=1 Tax=Chiropterargas boueti TaxID=1827022 RepID=A0A1P8AGF8_9ACAR|nr:NADH dehydrogenase subunit 4L [Chiropterargas boueti]AMX74114.1 NADH dehydrogenase subunit 4L [Chiropterargas boueti]
MLLMSFMIYFSGLLSMILNRSQILLVLLSIEYCYLGVMLLFYLVLSFNNFYLMLVMFLIFLVCEASVGLCILVINVYYYGNDKISLSGLMKWY